MPSPDVSKALSYVAFPSPPPLFPRHDGGPWRKEDLARSKKSGPLGFNAALLQLRGDWPFFKSIFGFKGWAGHEICWRCRANRADVPFDDCTTSAEWRKRRHTEASFAALQKRQGVSRSVLHAFPGFSMQLVCVDVLHAMDLGITQDVGGVQYNWEGGPSPNPGIDVAS